MLSPTRWKLRRAVRLVNRVLTGLRLEKATEKTFIGRVERGFDFLGYRLSPDGITVADATWKRFCERALRLYEREPESLEGLPSVGCVRQTVAWLEWPPTVMPPANHSFLAQVAGRRESTGC